MKTIISTTRLFIFTAFLGLLSFGLLSCAEGKTENTDNEKKAEASDGKNTDKPGYAETKSSDTNSEKASKDTPKGFKFEGTYNFTENVGKTTGGTGIMYSYTVIVTKENGTYKAKFNIDGYQTITRLECSVVETKINSSAPASSLILRYEKYGKDQLFKNPNLYKPQQEILNISPKGGIMAQPGEKDLDVIFMKNFTSDKQKNKSFVFKRVK